MATNRKPLTATWKGRGAIPNGQRVILPVELDGDPDKPVTLSVPLAKVEVLIKSLGRAWKEAKMEQAIAQDEFLGITHADGHVPNRDDTIERLAGEFAAFLRDRGDI